MSYVLPEATAVSLRRNERGFALRRLHLAHSFFPQEKRRFPRAQSFNCNGRPITLRVIARVKRAEKEPER